MLVNRAGTATYYAKHLRSNHSPFSSELLNNLNLLSNSNSNSSNSSSKEYHRRRCLNNQQTNKMSNKRSSNRQISPVAVATSSRHLECVPMASCLRTRMATAV
jgi:hypothetical protein